jgi:hypothetical protein
MPTPIFTLREGVRKLKLYFLNLDKFNKKDIVLYP